MKYVSILIFAFILNFGSNGQIIHYNGHYHVDCPPVESCFPFSADDDCTWGWLLRYESTMTQPDGTVVEMTGSTTHEFGGIDIQSSAANTPVCYEFTQTGIHTICITVYNYCWSFGFDEDSETRCIDVLVNGDDESETMNTFYCDGDLFRWCPGDYGVNELEIRNSWKYVNCDTTEPIPDENGCVEFHVCVENDLPSIGLANITYTSDCDGRSMIESRIFKFGGEHCVRGGEGGAVTEFDSIR